MAHLGTSRRTLWCILTLTACLAAATAAAVAAVALVVSLLLNTECSLQYFPPSRPQNCGIFNVDPRLGRWDAQHKYKMFDQALVGSLFIELSANHSVCLATQSSLEKLDSLVLITQNWKGPISAALFAAEGREFVVMQQYVDFLRRCYRPIRERISFHLAFPENKTFCHVCPQNERSKNQTNLSSLPDVSLPKMSQSHCRKPEVVLKNLLNNTRFAATRRDKIDEVPYPQNHLRNLARKNCQSPKVFLTDVDIIPSPNLADELNQFFKTERCKGLCAYVIPTYELESWGSFPRNKSALMKLTKTRKAWPFHRNTSVSSQFATNFSRWEQDDPVSSVHVSHKVTDFEFLYEPFYVADDAFPQHDERFIGYGFTRNSQVYEMYVAGYQFFVLSPVFTIHRKTSRWKFKLRSKLKSWTPWRERQTKENGKKFEQFKLEVFARYHKDPLNMFANESNPFAILLNNSFSTFGRSNFFTQAIRNLILSLH